jgi:hypothetical protein
MADEVVAVMRDRPVAYHLEPGCDGRLREPYTTSVTPMYQAMTPLCYQSWAGGFPGVLARRSM